MHIWRDITVLVKRLPQGEGGSVEKPGRVGKEKVTIVGMEVMGNHHIHYQGRHTH